MKGRSNLLLKTGSVVFIVALLFSCKKESGIPPGILTKEEMVAILSEFYITEEKLSRLNLPADSNEVLAGVLEGKVFDKLQVPDSTFSRSFDYYMDHPQELELIYTALVDSLQLKEQRAPSTTPQ